MEHETYLMLTALHQKVDYLIQRINEELSEENEEESAEEDMNNHKININSKVGESKNVKPRITEE